MDKTGSMNSDEKDSCQHPDSAPLWFSCRLVLGFISFVGFVNMAMLRVSINVAIVCMVNHSAVHEMHSVNQYEDDDNSTAERMSDNISDSIDNPGVSSCGNVNGPFVESILNGEFIWPKKVQGIILSSFFWGYILTQILGGWLATKFGGKRVLGYSLLLNAVCALLVPIGARTSLYLLVTLQAICGMSQGSVWPSMQALWTRWAPPSELGKLSIMTYCGQNVGIVLTFPFGAFLCQNGFGGGWPSIFYLLGGFGILWFIAWMFLAADSPERHPRITEKERIYITQTTSQRAQLYNYQKPLKIPWVAIMTSKAVWAMFIVHMSSNLGDYIFVTNISTYMKEVLKFDIQKNGLLSSLPYICQWTMSLLSGYLFDFVRVRGYMSRRSARRVGNTLGFTGQVIPLVILSFFDCTNAPGAVVTLTVSVALTGFFVGAGYYSNPTDIAPMYAGVIFGISNTLSSIPGFVGPTAVGYIVKNGTKEEWQLVFFIVAAVSLCGGIFGFIFVSGDVQPWAQSKPIEPLVIREETVALRDSISTHKLEELT